MQERTLLQDQYGFLIHDWAEAGAHTTLRTDQGIFYLYTAPVGFKYKNKFIERVKKHLKKQSDLNLLSLMPTQTGKLYVADDVQMYYLYRGIRESEPTDPAFAAGQSLARFHQSTGTFTGDRLFMPYSSLGSWPSMWRKKLRQYNAYRDDLDAFDGEITLLDEYLLTSYTYVHQLGDNAVQYLYEAGYPTVVKETAGCGKVAYQNFDQGYILWNEDFTRYVAGEWNWVIDMRARDIGQWLKAEVRRNGWDDEVAVQFLEGYNSVCPLLESEYGVIYGLMMYPGRFLKLVETYHALLPEEREEVDGEMWQAQLDDELQKMEAALRRFPQLIGERYGVCIPQVDWLWRPADDQTERIRDETTAF
jgi:spore coat protein YutH